jgi:hypothetical protein
LELDIDDDLLSDDSGNLNTLDDSEDVENIQEKDVHRGCVKVFKTKSNQEIKEMVRESTQNQALEDFDPNDEGTMKFFKEINAGLIPYAPQDNSLAN